VEGRSAVRHAGRIGGVAMTAMVELTVTPVNEPDRVALAALVLDRLTMTEVSLAVAAGGPVPRESYYWSLDRIVTQAVDGLVAEGVSELIARAARVNELSRRWVRANEPIAAKQWARERDRERGFGEGIAWRLNHLYWIVQHERTHEEHVAEMGYPEGRCRAVWCERCRSAEHMAVWSAGGPEAKAVRAGWGKTQPEQIWYVTPKAVA